MNLVHLLDGNREILFSICRDSMVEARGVFMAPYPAFSRDQLNAAQHIEFQGISMELDLKDDAWMWQGDFIQADMSEPDGYGVQDDGD
jgi:hypothetical protein